MVDIPGALHSKRWSAPSGRPATSPTRSTGTPTLSAGESIVPCVRDLLTVGLGEDLVGGLGPGEWVGDRPWLAALSRLIHRRRWGEGFAVTPATLLAWYRQFLTGQALPRGWRGWGAP